MSMVSFDRKVKKLVERMEDLAGHLFDDEDIKEFFIEEYDFDEYDAMSALMAYIKDNYIEVE